MFSAAKFSLGFGQFRQSVNAVVKEDKDNDKRKVQSVAIRSRRSFLLLLFLFFFMRKNTYPASS